MTRWEAPILPEPDEGRRTERGLLPQRDEAEVVTPVRDARGRVVDWEVNF